MNRGRLALLAVVLSACSPGPDHRESAGNTLRLGDSAERVLYRLGPAYFESRGPREGLIHGYLWDPSTDTYSGFGPGMLDEAMPGIHVALLYFEAGHLRDIIRVEGGVTDDMLSGHAQRYFLQKWSEESANRGRQPADRE